MNIPSLFNKLLMLTPAYMRKNFLLSIRSESTLVRTMCTVLSSGVAGLIRPRVGIYWKKCGWCSAKGGHGENTMSMILSPVVSKVARLWGAEFIRELEQMSPSWCCDFFGYHRPASTTDNEFLVPAQHFLPKDAYYFAGVLLLLLLLFSSYSLINIFWKWFLNPFFKKFSLLCSVSHCIVYN